jgi:5'-3' exonuclease
MDLNQVMISNLMATLGNHQNAVIDENMIRHMILNAIRSFKVKFGNDYGEMIICADDKNYWRKSTFPYYKASRKKNREESELDWNAIFVSLNRVREELKTFFPYKVIQIETAEADDIIGTIGHLKGTILNSGEKILILSSDKDYIQLHKYANIEQFDPIRKRWIKHSDPDQYLLEHIIKGDAGDGVPNVLSPDNCLVIGERQKPITQKRLTELSGEIANETILRNFKRNQMLIDLNYVPESIKAQVIEKFEEKNTKDKSQLVSYFMNNKLRNLMESLQEF